MTKLINESTQQLLCPWLVVGPRSFADEVNPLVESVVEVGSYQPRGQPRAHACEILSVESHRQRIHELREHLKTENRAELRGPQRCWKSIGASSISIYARKELPKNPTDHPESVHRS